MGKLFIDRLNAMLEPILNNHPIMLMILSGVAYFLGGIDETIITLIFLNVIDLVLGLFSNRQRKGVLATKIKMYIAIAIGVIIDRTFGFTDIKLRAYIILLYSYNELESILRFLKEDENLPIPKKIRQILNSVKEKEK